MTKEIEKILNPTITGIYFGYCKFDRNKSEIDGKKFRIDYERQYNCVISTGYNPFYENRNRTFVILFLIFKI